MFRTVPAHITPRPEDTEALARARAQLESRLEHQAHRERAVVAGTASMAMLDAAIEDKYLSRVLAGPVPLHYPRKVFKHRGSASVVLLVVFTVFAALAALALGYPVIKRADCAAIAQRYIDAPRGSIAEARAREEMDRESCYTEDAIP